MPYYVYDAEGKLVGYIEKSSDIERYLASLPEDFYSFPVGATAEDANRFMLQLNTRPDADTPSFFDRLVTRYGRVPVQINPFAEIKDLVFGNNAFFIKLKNFIDASLMSQLLSVLRVTLPAGSKFFLIMEATVTEEVYTGPEEESLEAFYAAEGSEVSSGQTAVPISSPVFG